MMITGLLILTFTLVYFFVLGAVKDDLAAVKQQLDTETKLLLAIQERVKKDQEALARGTLLLQEQIPTKPLMDQYILELEKAEVISDSQILSMSFAESALPTLEQETNSNQAAAAPNGATNQDSTSGEPAPAAEGTNAQVPAQNAAANQQQGKLDLLKRVTIALNVKASSYEEMTEFVRRVENMDRISTIDSLSFTGNDEGKAEPTSVDDKDQLNFTLTVSTFYLFGLEALHGDVPWTEYPSPSNKQNPLFVK